MDDTSLGAYYLKRSPWYYDNQKTNRLTCVSLHANTFRDEDGSWVQYKPGQKGVDRGGYSMVPLCTSILSEDFQVSMANSWNSTEGDAVSTLWSGVKQFAPYADYVTNAVKTLGKNAKEWKKEAGDKKNAAYYLATAAEKIGDIASAYGDTAIDYMNANLISQGTRFTYYSGTGVSFGNLQMRFTIFPEWTVEGTFQSVQQQLEELFPYVMGEYRPFWINITYKEDDPTKIDTTNSEEIQLLGWQMAPGGYRANFRDLDNAGMRGTLKLRIGSSYALESLLCENLNFTLSKQMVKKPQQVEYYGTKGAKSSIIMRERILSPLFADIVMSFLPATKYSDRAIRSFIYGLNLYTDHAKNEGADEVDYEMKKNLEELVYKTESYYGKSGNQEEK